MPSGKHKSRTLRKVFVKTPGSKVTTHFRKRKPSKAICASCKKQLAGVPRELPAKMVNLPKTAKRPERPYGGKLCSACTRVLLRQRVRETK